jgi:hypothetical protein
MATFRINQYLGYTKKLTKDLEKSFPINLNKTFSREIVKRIRRRAPNGSTGSLKKDVKVKVVSNREVDIIGPGHWYFVNQGVYPKRKDGNPMWLPMEVARAHRANPGSTAGKPVNIPKESVDEWFQVDSSRKGKGFVTDSLKSIRADAKEIIEEEFLRIAG